MNREKGITMVEILVVIAVIAVIAFALFPLISTTYESWRTADRRVELLQVGRLGMDNIAREIRRSYDLVAATSTEYLDFYPDWASDTAYRHYYNTDSASDLEFGVNSPFPNDYLAGPIESFEYLTYTRRMVTGVTEHRRVNSIRFRFEVSDERQVLNSLLNPMEFRTFVQLRNSREGYFIARTNAYASETYNFDRGAAGASDQFCVKAFCDRVDNTAMVTQTVTISCFFCPGWPSSWTFNMVHVPVGDYFEYCNDIFTMGIRTGMAWVTPSHRVIIDLDDGNEQCEMVDSVKIDP